MRVLMATSKQSKLSISTPPAVGELILAVDGGGTKTRCTLAEVGPLGKWRVLGTGNAGASNPRVVGVDAAAAAISEAVQIAKAEAGLDSFPCHRGLFAIAGTLHLPIRQALSERLAQLELADHEDVMPDLLPLIMDDTKNEVVALVSGTGSVGVGRDLQGNVAIAGGWGPWLGDDGSGFSLGRQALRQTLRALESGTPLSPMQVAICDELEAENAIAIKTRLAEANDQRELLARVAPVVLSTAMQNEPDAQAIVAHGAEELASLVQSVQSRLRLKQNPMRIVVSGGIFQAGGYLRDALQKSLEQKGITPKFTPIDDPTTPILKMLVRGMTSDDYQILP
ncbi:BadF/BadG/BcrA/BcrD ATPase family protein [Bremerella cremea]